MSALLYQDLVPTIDFTRDMSELAYTPFLGLDDPALIDFADDMEENNDSIELHLIRTKAYKEVLVLHLNQTTNKDVWKRHLQEEQKTFGGSKIFYISKDVSKILVLAVKNEMMNKLNMVVTRINKVNEKINRHNLSIKKDNLRVYETKVKDKSIHSAKDDVIHFINQHLKT